LIIILTTNIKKRGYTIMEIIRELINAVKEYPPILYAYLYLFSLPIITFLWLIYSTMRFIKTPNNIPELKNEQKNKTFTALGIFVFLIVLNIFIPISLITVPVLTILSFPVFLYNIILIPLCPKEDRKEHFNHIKTSGCVFFILLLSTILFLIVLENMPPSVIY
jgi:hypothetical protein